MCCWDTIENQRTKYTKATFESLLDTVDKRKHRIVIVDNASCKETKDLLEKCGMYQGVTIITNEKNLGTAEAINLAWRLREPGENAVKMDNDVVINHVGWADELEEAILRDPRIGQCGLKRKDCWENPSHPDPFYKSELIMLPHGPGTRWIVAERVNHVMGTCQMYSSALLDRIGYLCQPKLYGFDDSFASARSLIAGFINVFLPHIDIDHIDTGDTPYQKWKEGHAGECWTEYHRVIDGYKTGKISIYYNPFTNEAANINNGVGSK